MMQPRLLHDQARVWRWLALFGALTLAGLLAARFEIRWTSMTLPVASILFLHLTSRFYRGVRREPRLAATCEALAQLVLFTMIAGPSSYLAASHGGPLQDARLVEMDALFGLDWRTWLATLDAAPMLGRLLRFPYETLMPQLAAALLVLGFSGRLLELRMLVWAGGLSGIAAILLSALFPAAGSYAYFSLTPADFPHLDPSAAYLHLADFGGLRDGTCRIIDLATLKGIITFPSFHAALAALYAWAFWQHPATRWPGLAFETLVIVATPIEGGHYFVDVAGGVIVAILSIRAARRIVGHPAPARSPVAAPA